MRTSLETASRYGSIASWTLLEVSKTQRGFFDDKMAVVNVSARGKKRGIGMRR